jgi:hypothetical protein
MDKKRSNINWGEMKKTKKIKFCVAGNDEFILKKYKINMQAFAEQGVPYECPECEYDMFYKSHSCTIGMGEYPIGGFRASMKRGKRWGVGMECPKCFSKSCYHLVKKDAYQLFEMIEENKKK